MAYVSKAELTEQAKTLGATDEQLAGLTRDEIDALVETLSSDSAGVEPEPSEAETAIEESPAQPETDSAPTEDAEAGKAADSEVAEGDAGEQPDTAGAGDSEPVEDSESTVEVAEAEVSDGKADGTGETELETADAVVEESADAASVDEGQSGVVEDSPADELAEAYSGDADGGDEPNSAELAVGSGTTEPPDKGEAEAGTSEDAELTEDTPLPDECGPVADEDDSATGDADVEAVTETSENGEETDSPLLAREVESSVYRDELPTVFEIADAALVAANYDLGDVIVAEAACEVVRVCGAKRAVQASVEAGVALPYSHAGQLRTRTLRTVLHGMLGHFERRGRVDDIIKSVDEVCYEFGGPKLWDAVKEIHAYLGEPVDEPEETETASEPVEESAVESETGDASEDA